MFPRPASQGFQKATKGPWSTVVLALWHRVSTGLFLTLACLALATGFLWRAVLPAMTSVNTDFPNYYVPARLVLNGRDLSQVYDWAWLQRQANAAALGHQLVGFIPFPPPSALIMLPLAGLDPLTAKRVWVVFTVVLLLVAAWLLARRVTTSPYDETDPAFSPDGRQLFFVLNETGWPKIYTLDLRSGRRQQLTFGRWDDRGSQASPDGRWVAFASNQIGNWDVWVLDLADSSLRRITYDRASDTQPAWLDEDTLIFASDRRRGIGLSGLYTIDLGKLGYKPDYTGR